MNALRRLLYELRRALANPAPLVGRHPAAITFYGTRETERRSA